MSRVTWLTCACDMTRLSDMAHMCVWHDSVSEFYEGWLIHAYDMPRLCVWHDSSMLYGSYKCATWLSECLIYACDMTRPRYMAVPRAEEAPVWHDSFICVTWLSEWDLLGMTHWCVWHWSFTWHDPLMRVTRLIYVTWPIHACDMTHSCDMTHPCVWHDSFMRVTWLGNCSRSLWHDSFMRVTRLNVVTWLIYACEMTHLYDMAHSRVSAHGADQT